MKGVLALSPLPAIQASPGEDSEEEDGEAEVEVESRPRENQAGGSGAPQSESTPTLMTETRPLRPRSAWQGPSGAVLIPECVGWVCGWVGGAVRWMGG